jgi:hypothetical protein
MINFSSDFSHVTMRPSFITNTLELKIWKRFDSRVSSGVTQRVTMKKTGYRKKSFNCMCARLVSKFRFGNFLLKQNSRWLLEPTFIVFNQRDRIMIRQSTAENSFSVFKSISVEFYSWRTWCEIYLTIHQTVKHSLFRPSTKYRITKTDTKNMTTYIKWPNINISCWFPCITTSRCNK